MDSIIAREWFKYLDARDISRVAQISQFHARAIQKYLPEIVTALAQRKTGPGLIRAAIRASKNHLLETIAPSIPYNFMFGHWALELDNPGLMEVCLARGWYLVPLMYEQAILTRNEHICGLFSGQALESGARADYKRYLCYKYPLFGRMAEEMPLRLPDIYGEAAARAGNLAVFEQILGKIHYYDDIVRALGQNTNAGFVSEVLKMHFKYMRADDRKECFKSACEARNRAVILLFKGKFCDLSEGWKFSESIAACDIEITKKFGDTIDHDDYEHYTFAVYSAYKSCYRPNINYLLKKCDGYSTDAFYGACHGGNIELMKEVLAKKPDIYPRSAFMCLGMSNNLEAIIFGLENIDFEECTEQDCLNSILRGQAKIGGDLFNVLLEIGANFDDADQKMLSRMIHAGNWKNIIIAMENGVDLDALIHVAASNGAYDILHRLIKIKIEKGGLPENYDLEKLIGKYAYRELISTFGIDPGDDEPEN